MKRSGVVIILGVLCAGVLALVLVSSGSENEDGGTGATDSTGTTDGAEPSAVVTFVPDEAHADLPATPGCDQLFFHSSMAMFNPSLADELLLFECPFPFDPESISMEGGAEDPAITAPYEPRRYQELFDQMTVERIGVCTIGRIPEPSERGYVYGFSVSARPETCATSIPTLEVNIREYASKAHRDAAANDANAAVVQVLGRFTVTIDGEDPAAVDRLAGAFGSVGAQVIPA